MTSALISFRCPCVFGCWLRRKAVGFTGCWVWGTYGAKDVLDPRAHPPTPAAHQPTPASRLPSPVARLDTPQACPGKSGALEPDPIRRRVVSLDVATCRWTYRPLTLSTLEIKPDVSTDTDRSTEKIEHRCDLEKVKQFIRKVNKNKRI